MASCRMEAISGMRQRSLKAAPHEVHGLKKPTDADPTTQTYGPP
jgi:hypothetical protein